MDQEGLNTSIQKNGTGIHAVEKLKAETEKLKVETKRRKLEMVVRQHAQYCSIRRMLKRHVDALYG